VAKKCGLKKKVPRLDSPVLVGLPLLLVAKIQN
jgi:hypothetical protein